MTFIKTYSGEKFSYISPESNDIKVIDIAHALSREQRFGGHLTCQWSVGQHSLLVRKLVELEGGTPKQMRIALHHDSAETYVKDVASPLRKQLSSYNALYNRVVKVVEKRLGLTLEPLDPLVKEQDKVALHIEDVLFFKKTDWTWHDFTMEDYARLSLKYHGELSTYIEKLLSFSPEKTAEMFLHYHFNSKQI